MKHSENHRFKLISLLIFGMALIIHVTIVMTTAMNFRDALLLLPIPIAWCGALLSALLVGHALYEKYIQKKEISSLHRRGALLLGTTSVALLLIWVLLLSRSWGNSAKVEELIFPLFLFTGLSSISLFYSRKAEQSTTGNLTFLVIAVLIFTFSRESGEFNWNWYGNKNRIESDIQSSYNSNGMNWGTQSVFPGDHGATYTISYNGLSGSVGRLLQKRYSRGNEFPPNAAYVRVSGTVTSPGLTSRLPLIKWGSTRVRLTVQMSYMKSIIGDEPDLNNSSSLTFTASSTISLKIEQRLIGIASIYEYNSLLAKEIHKAVQKQVQKEMRISSS